MCIVFSIIERVYWYLMVILSSMFVDESSYVSFPISFFFFVFTLSHLLLESEMSDLLLGALGYCLFHHYIHYWCDFTPYLIWVDHHFSLYTHYFAIILVIACDSSHSLHPSYSFLTLTYSRFNFSLPSFLCISLSVWFTSLSHYWYYIHIGHHRVHGSRAFLYMLHFIHKDMGFLSLGIWA